MSWLAMVGLAHGCREIAALSGPYLFSDIRPEEEGFYRFHLGYVLPGS